MSSVWLYFANGTFLEARSFGASGTMVGEVVFNTSMGGFQEVISNPSNAGLFINFAMSEVGNYGVNEQDDESNNVYTKGIIVRNYQDRYSNFRATASLGSYLKKHSVMGICDIDTRFITMMIRDSGVMAMVASTEISSKDELKKILDSSISIDNQNLVEQVSTKSCYKHTSSIYSFVEFNYEAPPLSEANVAVVDLGVKKSMLNELVGAKMSVEVYPYTTSASELISKYKNREIDGVVLSSGPSNPAILKDVISNVEKLFEAKVPLFGVGLGHELMALACGMKVEKLKFGHHGSNHPVKNSTTSKVELFAQNHIYNVVDAIDDKVSVTYKNIFDGTIEAFSYKDSPAISTQFYPTATSRYGSDESVYKEFLSLIKR